MYVSCTMKVFNQIKHSGFFFQCHYSTYNPQQNIENKEILRSLNVESAAKRRDFRINERKRLAQLQEKKVDSHSQKSVSKIPNEPSTSRDEKVSGFITFWL